MVLQLSQRDSRLGLRFSRHVDHGAHVLAGADPYLNHQALSLALFSRIGRLPDNQSCIILRAEFAAHLPDLKDILDAFLFLGLTHCQPHQILDLILVRHSGKGPQDRADQCDGQDSGQDCGKCNQCRLFFAAVGRLLIVVILPAALPGRS